MANTPQQNLYVKLSFDAEALTKFKQAHSDFQAKMHDLNEAAKKLQDAMYAVGSQMQFQQVKPDESLQE